MQVLEKNIDFSQLGSESYHQGLTLKSVFQPIFSLYHRRVVGYEGLLRAYSPEGQFIEPLRVFHEAIDESEVVHLDRLSRALHVHNFASQAVPDSWLFLNINPKVVVRGKYYGAFFQELLQRYAIEPSKVVVEIIEGAIEDEVLLSESVNFYKELGCLVAIDDFGAGHSNFERIWRLSPDIVKLDRSMITQAVQKPKVRRVLPGIVSLIHEAGSLVLIEGIETREEAMVAMETDLDLVQGNYFSKPSDALNHNKNSTEISDLFKRFGDVVPLEAECRKSEGYTFGMAEAAEKISTGYSLEMAASALIGLSDVDRCYLLNQSGVQIGHSVIKPSGRKEQDERYIPLADGDGATWFRRPYLREALQHPRELQVTKPYVSIATGRLCITLSVALTVLGRVLVFCCDINWNDTYEDK